MQCLCRKDVGSFGTPFVNVIDQWETKTMAKHAEILIGKFDILATFTYAKALLDGAEDSEARERGSVLGKRNPVVCWLSHDASATELHGQSIDRVETFRSNDREGSARMERLSGSVGNHQGKPGLPGRVIYATGASQTHRRRLLGRPEAGNEVSSPTRWFPSRARRCVT